MAIQLGGVISGMDTDDIIRQLLDIEAANKTKLEKKKETVQGTKDLFGELDTKLLAFKAESDKLLESSTFRKRTVASSNTDSATATVTDGAAIGVFNITVDNKATQSRRQSSAVVSLSESVRSTSPVTASTNAVDLTKSFAAAGFDSTLNTASTVSITTSAGVYNSAALSTYGSVQNFLDEINASAAGVRMWYDSANDRFNLEVKNNLVTTIDDLQDTVGNFFSEVNIATGNPAGGVNQAGLNTGAKLKDLNTDVAIASGSGSFKINGASINYNTATDTLQNLIDRINSSQSSTGVVAFYDQSLDKLVLSRQTEGPQQIDIDVTNDTQGVMGANGLKISSAATTAGDQAVFFINGNMITSDSNTYTFNGVTINLTGDGDADNTEDVGAGDASTTITVTQDTSSVSTAVKAWVDAYNEIVGFYETNARYDSSSKTAGKLFGDSLVNSVDAKMKRLLFQSQPQLVDTHELLAQLGIQLGDYDTDEANKLVVDDAKLTDAIASNPSAFEELFGRSRTGGLIKNAGIAYDVSDYIKELTKFNGLIDVKEQYFTDQITGIDDRIFNEEDRLATQEATLRRQFSTMEQALAKLNAEGASISQQLSRL